MRISRSHWQKTFYMLFALLFGFLGGALFGTVLPFVRNLFFWDGLIIVSLLIIIEFLSYISYRPSQPHKNDTVNNRSRFCSAPAYKSSYVPLPPKGGYGLSTICTCNRFVRARKQSAAYPTFLFYGKGISKTSTEKSSTVKMLSFFKIGLMIGFFVDAFKVGS